MEPDNTIQSRLDELLPLEAGWYYGGTGEAIDKNDKEKVSVFLHDLKDAGIMKPYIYPSPNGAIHCEYRLDNKQVTMVVKMEENEVDFTVFNSKGQDIKIQEENSFAMDNLKEIAHYLRPLLGDD